MKILTDLVTMGSYIEVRLGTSFQDSYQYEFECALEDNPQPQKPFCV